MRRPELFLALALILGIGFVATQAVGRRAPGRGVTTPSAPVRESPTAADSAFGDSIIAAAEVATPALTPASSSNAAPERDPVRIRFALQDLTPGSYIQTLFLARDSVNYRWPERRRDPMRIWVQPSTLPGYRASYPDLVRRAFSTWSDAGIPIFVTFVLDSARAEIHVTWIDRFTQPITGRTRWLVDRHGWIVGGSIELALHRPDGRELVERDIEAIALHEVGHLIGLDHSADPGDVMAARVRVAQLSEADRRTARLIYALPPGSIKTP